MKQEYSSYFTDVGITNDKGNVGHNLNKLQHASVGIVRCAMFQCFETDLDFTGINILTKFHELWIKIVLSRVYT